MTSNARSDLAEHAVADVEDLDAVIADASVEPNLRRRLHQVRDRRLAEVPAVPVSAAGRLLGVSPQTVRAWLAAGVLEAVAGLRPIKVSTSRLAEVVGLVQQLRRAGQDRDLLTAVVNRLDDERVVDQRNVRRSLGELRRGEIEAFSAEDI